MKILAFALYYWPEKTSSGVYNTGRLEYLASRGHEVTVLTGFPHYPEWRVCDAYRGRIWFNEYNRGVNIKRSYVYVPRVVTSTRRIVYEASYIASSLIRSMGGSRPDIVLTISGPLGLAASSVLLSRRWKVPYLFHVEDLHPDTAADLGMLKPGRLLNSLYALERFAYRNAALVSTVTDSMRQKIIAKEIVPADKVVTFRHWADPSNFAIQRSGRSGWREQLGLTEKFLVVHAGNMGVKQGLDVILNAASLTRELHDVVYLIVGDGAERERLTSLASDMSLENVLFLPLQPRPVFEEILSSADVSLITQQRSVTDIVFPSKTVTLLSAGCPVIASVSEGSEVARVIREADAGLVVDPENSEALRHAILTIRDAPHSAAEMSSRARAYAKRLWDRDTVLPAMESELLRIAGNHRIWAAPRARSVEN